MGTGAKVYLSIVALVMLLSLLLAMPDLGIVALFLTFGLAMLLFPLPTLLPYLAAVAPAVFSPRGWTRLGGVLAAATLAAAWAYLPHQRSESAAAQTAALLIAGDFTPAAMQGPRSLELRRPRSFQHSLGSWLPDEPCSQFCRSLLLGGAVDWVRVVMVDAGVRGKEKTSSTRYAAAAGPACAAPGDKVDAAARCVIFAEDKSEAAALRIEVTETRGIERLKQIENASFGVNGMRTVNAFLREAGAYRPILRHTEVQFDVIVKGSILIVAVSGMSSGGIEFLRSTRHYNATDAVAILGRLGYPAMAEPPGEPAPQPESWRSLPSADLSRNVQSLLDLPDEAPFNQEQSAVINAWLMRARGYEDWPDERLAILQRIVRDERVQNAWPFSQIFERRRAVTEGLLPDVLERLAGADDKGDLSISAAHTFGRIDADLLKPHAAAILALVESGKPAADAVRMAIGRLGIDPTRFLLPVRKPDGDIDNLIVRAACFADLEWSGKIVPALRSLVVDKTIRRWELDGVYQALYRHGDEPFLMAQSVLPGEERLAKELQRLKRRAARSATPYC